MFAKNSVEKPVLSVFFCGPFPDSWLYKNDPNPWDFQDYPKVKAKRGQNATFKLIVLGVGFTLRIFSWVGVTHIIGTRPQETPSNLG